jgi:tetratricopeptide (TPR) repeat protein
VRPNIVRAFLSVVELLETNKVQIPLHWSILTERATQSGQFAQALRYNEYQFQPTKADIAKNLISLNLKLGLRLAANGILAASQVKSEVFQQSLGMWDNALQYYDSRLSEDPENTEWRRGKMECLYQLHRYKDLSEFTGTQEGNVYAASAALRLFDYETFRRLMQTLDPDDPGIFNFFVIWHLLENRLDDADAVIKRWNHIHVARVFPMNPEDFDLHEASLFAELSDIIELKRIENLHYSASPFERKAADARRQHILDDWNERFRQLTASPMSMFDTIVIRSLVLNDSELQPFWFTFLGHEMAFGRTQLLEIAMLHVNSELPQVQFVECVLQRQSSPAEAVSRLEALLQRLTLGDSLLIRFLKQLSDWHLEDGDWDPALAALRRIVELAPKASDSWERWARATYMRFELTKDPECLRNSLLACLTGLKIGSSLSFALQILSILGKYADSSILGVFLESYQNIQSKVWIALLPQITAMLRNPQLTKVLEQILLFVAVASAHIVNVRGDIGRN